MQVIALLFFAIALVVSSAMAPADDAVLPTPAVAFKSPAIGLSAAQGAWCRYPARRPRPEPPAIELLLSDVAEAEPNNAIAQAQAIPLGVGPGLDIDVSISGAIGNPGDIDIYRLTLNKGDIVGLACLNFGNLDSVVSINAADGSSIFENDDHGGLDGLYPPSVPWPVAASTRDSALTFVAPNSADFLVVVTSFGGNTSGSYSLQLRHRRAFPESSLPSPLKQILFIDFNGATINALAAFGEGGSNATLSPLSAFLANWGLTPADENAVINAILAVIQQNFNDMRLASLNGNFPVDAVPGHFDVEIRNSRDHPDPFGQAHVSRVIVGGTSTQLGIDTIGIAQFVDPGNFSLNDSAVCLLDALSSPSPNPNSVLSIPRDPGITLIDAIGKIVGNIVSHEAGHFLGCWHTRNDDVIGCLMDTGGDLPNLAGVGPDNTLGTFDDIENAFFTDEFDSSEGVGIGDESTQVVTAFALSTGGLPPDVTPPSVTTINPPAAANLGALPSVAITFDEQVAQLTAADLTINGAPATQISGSGAGPFQFSGFPSPADGTVNVALGNAIITDLSGNSLPVQTWSYNLLDCNNNGVFDGQDIAGGATDCNANGIPDACDAGMVQARAGFDGTFQRGVTLVLGDATPAQGGTPPYAFFWTISGNGIFLNSTEANPSFQPPAIGVFVGQFVVTDAIGCQSSDSVTLTIQEPPPEPVNPAPPVEPDPGNMNVDPQPPPDAEPDNACGGACGAPGAALYFAVIAAPMVVWRRRRRRVNRFTR